MIHKGIVFSTALTVLSTAAHAGSAPKELYGKSISVAWTETMTGRFESEPQQTRSFGRSLQMQVYISTAGRPFARLLESGYGGLGYKGSMSQSAAVTSRTFETAPGQSAVTDHVDFQGHSVVVYRELQSGARKISIDLDGASCRATAVVAKQAGKAAVQQIVGRGNFESSSVQVGTVTCSIREGNVFGQ